MLKIECAESGMRFSVSADENTGGKDMNRCARETGRQRGILRDVEYMPVKRAYDSFITQSPYQIIF